MKERGEIKVLRESSEIEFKEFYSKTLLKDVVAFANTDGGTIYVGVNDDGEPVGLNDIDATQVQISNSIKDAIMPDVIPFIKIETVEIEGKNVLKMFVAAGSEKPYFLREKGLSSDGVYIRRGSSCQPLGISGIRSMILESSGRSFEEGRSLEQNLTFDVFKHEMESRNIECGTSQMRTLHLIGKDGLYTNLALLLSDQCPYTIKVAVFQGRDKTVFRNRKEFSGSLLKQLDDSYSFIDIYNNTKATFKGLYRTDKRDYPEDALREALLNSIIHRDYSFNGSTIINVFEDHVEFASLGGLAPGLSLEAILMGVSESRNPNLAAVFYRMEIVESYGIGIDKIMGLYSNYPVKPLFQTAEGAFQVVLHNMNDSSVDNDDISEPGRSETKDGNKTKLLTYLSKNVSITRRETERLLGLGSTSAYYLLKELTEGGYIMHSGSGRTSRYTLIRK